MRPSIATLFGVKSRGKLFFSPDKSRRKHTKKGKKSDTIKIYYLKYFVRDWIGIKFRRGVAVPQNDNKVTQNCYHQNGITLCWGFFDNRFNRWGLSGNSLRCVTMSNEQYVLRAMTLSPFCLKINLKFSH
jgi:hypothetical protein